MRRKIEISRICIRQAVLRRFVSAVRRHLLQVEACEQNKINQERYSLLLAGMLPALTSFEQSSVDHLCIAPMCQLAVASAILRAAVFTATGGSVAKIRFLVEKSW
jgi:hypothetical protein